MAEYGLGTAKGKVEIDATGVKTGLDDAKGAVNQFDSNLKSHGQTLTDTGAKMTGVGVAGVAAFGFVVKAAADFETRLNAVKAVSGATDQQMEAIRQTALRIGKDTKFSATEAASALEELVKAGISVDDAVNGAADATVNLAAAGEIELPEAATIAANAMNNFGLSAKEMPRIADLIAGAANASAIDVGEFGFSLQQAGAVANLAGLSFDDLAVAIAAMGNAGIKGSDAGTSLKTFLQNLQPSTKKQITLFKELGLMTEDGANKFYTAEGSVKSFAEISQTLQDALQGQTDQQKQASLETLFGTDAIRAAAVAADNGAAGINGMAEAMGKVSAADVAKTRMQGLSGTIEQLKGSLETAAIILGTPFLQSINGVVQAFGGLVDAFAGLSPETQKLIVQIVLVASTLFIAVGAFTFIVGSVLKAVVAFKEFAAAMKFIAGLKFVAPVLTAIRTAVLGLNAALLANPIGLVIIAVVALIAGLVLLYKKNETFRNAVNNLAADIKQAALAVWEFIKMVGERLGSAFSTAYDAVSNFITGAVKFFQELPGRISTFITNLITSIVTYFQELPGRVVAALQLFAQEALAFFQSLPGRLAYAIGFIVGAVVGFFMELPGRIAYALGFIVGRIVAWGLAARTAIVTAVSNFIEEAITFFTELPGRIQAFLTDVITRLAIWGISTYLQARAMGEAFLNSVVEFFTQLPGRVEAFLTDVITRIAIWAITTYMQARAMGEQFLNNIIEFFTQLPGNVEQFLRDTINRIVNWVSNTAAEAARMGTDFYNNVTNGIRDLPGAVSGIMDRMIEAVRGAARRAFDAVKGLAADMWRGFQDGLGIHSPSFIEEAMFAMVRNVDGSISDLRKQVKTVQGLGSSLPQLQGDLGATSSSAGLRPANGASGTNAASVVNEGDTFNLEAHTDASSEEIVSDFMWKKRVKAS